VYILVLVQIIIYVVVAMAMRQYATVHMGLCPIHRAKRKNAVIVTTLLVLVFVLSLVGGIAVMINVKRGEGIGMMCILGAIIALIGAAIAGNWTRPLSPKKIEGNYAWYSGAGEAFLQQLPPVR
jgi:hypothetical protein